MLDKQKEEEERRIAALRELYNADPEYTPNPRNAIRAGEEAIAMGLYNAATMYFTMSIAICLTRREQRECRKNPYES